MISTLQLGQCQFPNNLIQGPLAGISAAPFRRLSWVYSQPAYNCTEMISCKTLLNKSLASQQRFVKKDPEEGPVCFQLSASDPRELGEATARVTQLGADLIDLNCGCPVKKIRSKGAGSSHLTRPQQLYQLITAMKQNTHLPVSVKIRVEGGSQDTFNAEVAKVVTEAGADVLIVHGRHWTEHYETPCNYDDIRFFVQAMKIPVIGNGDVACLPSLKKMFATGCHGVMIGRAGVGQPWLIKKLIADMTNTVFIPPSSAEIAAMFLQHTQELSELLQSEKFALLNARKFAKYYARSIPDRAAFCEAINQCERFSQLQMLCERFFIT